MIGHFLLDCWSWASGLALCLTGPGDIELLLLSVAAAWPSQRGATATSGEAWRISIVVPAHDEEASIGACLDSIRAADRGGFDVEVFVVADNCADSTAQIAAGAGAAVIERVDPVHRGKGFALDYAFRQLKPMGFDAILVVDADSTVGSNFIVATGEALRGRAAAVQARYLTANPHESPRTRLMDFALRAFNFVRPLGREHLGVSAGILGNGFGLRAETLAAVPYLTSSVAEDLEYHVALARSGRRVRFIDETTVLGHMPVSGAGAKSQRARWEGGRLRVLFSHAIPLLGDIFRGRLGSLEPLLDLATLPLAFHVLLLVFAAITPVAMVRSLALVGIAIVLLHLGVTIALGTTRRRDIQTLASAPGYILWKLLLIPLLLRSARSDQPWVRTSRDTK